MRITKAFCHADRILDVLPRRQATREHALPLFPISIRKFRSPGGLNIFRALDEKFRLQAVDTRRRRVGVRSMDNGARVLVWAEASKPPVKLTGDIENDAAIIG